MVWFNLVIGAFNLLPAFPLDGGRVLRALLERRYDLERATHMAARVGRGLAVALIAIGVFANVWFVFIGVFVYFGASAEEAATVVHLRLRNTVVSDVMVLDPLVVDPATGIAELRLLLRKNAQDAYPVVGAQGYEGMVDAATIAATYLDRVAADLVIQQPTLSPTADLETEALALVETSPVHAVAVAEQGRIVGLLRRDDIRRRVSTPTRRE